MPFRANTNAKTYIDAFRSTVESAVDRVRPELILLSAGFDAHRLDPIGGFSLETGDFVTMTEIVLATAKTHSNGRVVSCLEGGYHWQATAESAAAHLETLLAHDA